MRHPPPPALQHATTVRGAVNVRGMPRTCGEASPPPGRAGVGCLQPVAERPPTHCPAPSAPVPLALCQVPVPGEAR